MMYEDLCTALKSKDTPMLMRLSGTKWRPLARNFVDRRHSITEMATRA